jgi:hypothetical protein
MPWAQPLVPLANALPDGARGVALPLEPWASVLE